MYYVILPTGEKFGPADLTTLQSWVNENRVQPNTIIEDAVQNVQIPASRVIGLNFPNTSPPPQGPGMGNPNPYEHAPGPQSYAGYYNRSGPGTSPSDPLPAAYRKFNWGAFMFTWIWGLNHKKPELLGLIGLGLIGRVLPDSISYFLSAISLGLSIWIGTQGNEWAWKSGRFSSPDEMQRCQTTWAWWALGFFILCFVLVLFAVMIPLMAMGSRR